MKKYTKHSLTDKWTRPVNKDERVHQANMG